jgi:hypothetical protein
MTQLTLVAAFPCEDHRRELVAKVAVAGLGCLDDIEKYQFHAYRYAWRRVRLGDFTQKYAVDPKGDWFDGFFVNKAVEFYTGGKYLKPPIAQSRAPPSAEDVAHVEKCARGIRKNLGVFGERNRAAFAQQTPPPSADAAALAKAQRELGITVTETTGETKDRSPEPVSVRETEAVPA